MNITSRPFPKKALWISLAVAFSQVACTHAELQTPTENPTSTHSQANGESLQNWQGSPMNVDGGAPQPNAALGERKRQGEEDDAPPEPKIRIYEGTGVTLNPPKRVVAVTGEAGEFNFEEAPISEVIHVMMGEILKADYVLHQPINGTLTLSTRNAISKDTALSLLETALLANGLLMAQDSRGFYHIGTAESLRGVVPAPRMAGAAYGPIPPGYGIILMPLEYIGAAEMAEILKPVMNDNSLLRVDPIRNMLVLAGTRPQAEGWLDLVKTFDVDMLKGMSVGIFPLKYATVTDVQSALQLVAGGTPDGAAGAAGAANPGARGQQQANQTPQQRAQQQRAQQQAQRQPGAQGANTDQGGTATPQILPVLGSLRLVPLERLNSIMVITPRSQYLEQVKTWIERLDQPNDSTEPQLFVYPVQNGSASHLAQVLGGIFGGSGAGSTTNSGVAPGLNSNNNQSTGFNSNFSSQSNNRFGSSAGFGGGNMFSNSGMSNNQQSAINTAPVAMDLGSSRVIADPLNNAILVWGTRPEFERIEATLKRLDKQPVQVMIEASIVEVTLTNDLQFGLRWAFNGGVDGFRGTGGSTNVINKPLSEAYTALKEAGSANAFTYALTKGERVAAMLNMLATRSLAKMLSSPSLLVIDNHTASINVGDQIPVSVGSTNFNSSLGSTVTSYQYRDTGLSLQITPSVNAGDLVTLTVDQNLSGVGSRTYGDTRNPSFIQRQVSSKVAVKSGEPIVLGGLIKEDTSNSNSGIPGLVDIPVARHAFGETNNANSRTELLVIITPTVVRSNDELRNAGNELRDRMQDLMRTRIEEIKRGGPVLPGEEDLLDLVQPVR